MASLGLWNLVIIALVTVVLRRIWRRDRHIIFNATALNQYPALSKLLRFLQHPISTILIQIILILLISRGLIYTGWVAYRLTQADAPFWDFKQFYVVSQILFERLNPYDLATFAEAQCQWVNECYQGSFIYFPNIMPFIWFLGYFDLPGASSFWVVLHFIAILFILWGCSRLLMTNSNVLKIVILVFCALIYGVVFDLRVGNVSTIIVALLVWCVIYARENRNVAAGILLGISTIKPTISALFFLYFLFKRRWKVLVGCLVTTSILLGAGFLIIGDPLLETIRLYLENYRWVFANHPSGDPFTAPARIDLGVIGPRLLPQQPTFAKVFSQLLSLVSLVFVGLCFYRKYQKQGERRAIELADIALIGCLSILIFYSQRHTTAILVFTVIYLVNYAIKTVNANQLTPQKIGLLITGLIILLSQTGWLYYRILEPLEGSWKAGDVNYLTQITIGTFPNYSLLILLGIIGILASEEPISDSTL